LNSAVCRFSLLHPRIMDEAVPTVDTPNVAAEIRRAMVASDGWLGGGGSGVFEVAGLVSGGRRRISEPVTTNSDTAEGVEPVTNATAWVVPEPRIRKDTAVRNTTDEARTDHANKRAVLYQTLR